MEFVEFQATQAGNMFILLALKLMTLLLLMGFLRILSYALSYFLCISTTSVIVSNAWVSYFCIHVYATNSFYAKSSLSELEVIFDNNLKPNLNYLMATKLSLNLVKTNFIIFQHTPSLPLKSQIFKYPNNLFVTKRDMSLDSLNT